MSYEVLRDMKSGIYFFSLLFICFTLESSIFTPTCFADDSLEVEFSKFTGKRIEDLGKETREFAKKIYHLEGFTAIEEFKQKILDHHTTEFREDLERLSKKGCSQEGCSKNEKKESSLKAETNYHLLYIYLDKKKEQLKQQFNQRFEAFHMGLHDFHGHSHRSGHTRHCGSLGGAQGLTVGNMGRRGAVFKAVTAEASGSPVGAVGLKYNPGGKWALTHGAPSRSQNDNPHPMWKRLIFADPTLLIDAYRGVKHYFSLEPSSLVSNESVSDDHGNRTFEEH